MSALAMLSIALLLASLAGSAVLWNRSGETRVGLFGGLFLLVAIHQAVAPWTNWNDPLGWNLSSLGGLIGLAVGALGVLAVVALWRTLAERDRAEKLHWDSMEIVRVINELSEADSVSLDAKIAKLLEMGTARFDLEIAMLARVRNDRYEIIAIRSPESFPATSGAAFSLEQTFCNNTLNSGRPVGIERISESNWAEFRHRSAFPFDAYLGTTVTVDGARYGTLSFASFEPRKERFNGTEKDLLRLIAQWIGSEIESHTEREVTANAPIDAPVEDSTLAALRPTAVHVPQPRVDKPAVAKTKEAPAWTQRSFAPRHAERAIDPNRILRRSANELRGLAGDSVHLVMKLDPDLGFAAAQNLPLEAIVRTLVMNARDAMPEGGELVVETANLEIAAGEPDQMPAVVPDRYVTLSFMDSGREPDPEALSRLFDCAPTDDERPRVDDRLVLPTVYRMLQICGGDLSVKIEPGSGSTFTVYLPRTREQVRAPRKAAPALAPAVHSPTAH